MDSNTPHASNTPTIPIDTLKRHVRTLFLYGVVSGIGPQPSRLSLSLLSRNNPKNMPQGGIYTTHTEMMQFLSFGCKPKYNWIESP